MTLACAELVSVSGHQMDLSKAKVVDAHPHTLTHCQLESWHIQHEQATQCQDSTPPCWTDVTLFT